MSILIKGMDMPKKCCECIFALDSGLGKDMVACIAVQGMVGVPKKSGKSEACPLVEVEEFEVWPNLDKKRAFNILKTKGGMHFMGPNGPVDPPKGD